MVYVVKNTVKRGKGLFASEAIVTGMFIVPIRGVVLDYQTEHTYQLTMNTHLDPTTDARYLNHCCSPNAGIRNRGDGMYDVVAICDIQQGEEMTIDYGMTEFTHYKRDNPEDEFDLTCHCKSDKCRGKFGYYPELPKEVRERYKQLGTVARYLLDWEFPVVSKHEYWKHVSLVQWNDWKWQQVNRVKTMEKLSSIVPVTANEKLAFSETKNEFRMAITPYYLSLIDFSNSFDPLRLQAVPQLGEVVIGHKDVMDPLGEEDSSPLPALVHRYPDRVLLYTTHNCPVYCRHCTRKRKVSDPLSSTRNDELEKAIAYIGNHAEVRDVLLSGGDALSLSDERLFSLIKKLQALPHIEVIRIGTRNLVTLPQRITWDFCKKLKKLNENGVVYINTHFNHPNELTPEAFEACKRLRLAGSPVNNQTVLLRAVNDSVDVQVQLHKKLLQFGIRPYYLFLCDQVVGTHHFRTTVELGLEVIDNLRGHTSGMACPQLAIDGPGGKILLPNGIIGRVVDEDRTIWKLVNYEGKKFYYSAPSDDTLYYSRYERMMPPSFVLSSEVLS